MKNNCTLRKFLHQLCSVLTSCNNLPVQFDSEFALRPPHFTHTVTTMVDGEMCLDFISDLRSLCDRFEAAVLRQQEVAALRLRSSEAPWRQPEPRRKKARSSEAPGDDRLHDTMIPAACVDQEAPEADSMAWAEEKAMNVGFPLDQLPPEIKVGHYHKTSKHIFLYCTVCRCYPCWVKFSWQHKTCKGDFSGFCPHFDGPDFEMVCLEAARIYP